jgi:steroid 5-alpha reductase family enzyme
MGRRSEGSSPHSPHGSRAWIAVENYFFEWVYWVGLAVYELAFPAGWIALGGQALILASILKVTGIPATEAQALRSKGDAYRAYQARVSSFVPLPRRKSSPASQ